MENNNTYYKRKLYKAGVISLSIGVFIALFLQFLAAGNTYAKPVQEGIAKEILRFHVLANSDTEEDQKLKIKVKNAVSEYLTSTMQEVKTKKEACVLIESKKEEILEVAGDVINQNGYTYSLSAQIENCYFPMKIYGDMTFPPGYYDAFRIEIGKAEGKNWWCVMFPNLCFVDETYSVVPYDSKLKMKEVLTAEEYQELLESKSVKVVPKFRTAEFFWKKSADDR